jgi:hypothetical protein
MQNLYKCTEGVVAKLSQRRQSKQLQTMISGCRLANKDFRWSNQGPRRAYTNNKYDWYTIPGNSNK